MAFVTTREEQLFFINSTQVRGVQNVDFDFNVGASPNRALGNSLANLIPATAQVGKVQVNMSLISSDPFTAFLYEVPANGFIVRSKADSNYNYSFTSGYLTNYSFRVNIGQIPQISAEFDVFGNMGQLSAAEANTYFTGIAASTQPVLNIAHSTNIALSVNGFNPQRVYSFEIGYNIPRRADFILNSIYPRRVTINYPIEVTASFTISVEDYSAYNLRAFPSTPKITDLLCTVRNPALATITSFNHVGMTLVQESYSSSTDNKATVTLTYRGLLYNKSEIPRNSLLFYLNASHRKSYSGSGTVFKDLTFNHNDFTIQNGTFSNGHILFGGSTSLNHGSNFIFGGDITVSAWVQSSNITNGGTAYVFSWNTNNGVAFGPDDLSQPSFLAKVAGTFYNVGSVISASNFTMITMVFNGSQQKAFSYVNGSAYVATTYSNSVASSSDIYVGSLLGSSLFFNGIIDKIAVFTRALTAAEVQNLYLATYFQ